MSNRYRTNDTSFWNTHSIEQRGEIIYISSWYNKASSTMIFTYNISDDTMGNIYQTDIKYGTMLKRNTQEK